MKRSHIRQLAQGMIKQRQEAIDKTNKHNVTLADATSVSPFTQYAMCINADNRPAKHNGDWPMMGTIYPVRLMPSKTEGIDIVHILGFEGYAPYFNGFSIERFAFGVFSMPIGLN